MDLSQIRVLVADDEPKLRALVANALRALGCSVVEAQDGDEAWHIAQHRRVDVVVLDVMMPGMSGWDVCRRLKTDRALRESPGGAPKVLMLTGIGEAVNEMTSPLFSADAWLDKPFSMREMTEKVIELARGSWEPPASLPPDVLPETPRPRAWETERASDSEQGPTVRAVGPSLKKVMREVPELARAATPKPKAVAKPKPKAVGKPKAVAKPKPKAVAKSKAVAKPKPKAVGKPKAVAKPKAKAVAKPKRKAVAKPKRKAIAKPKRKAVVAKPKRKAVVAKPKRKAVVAKPKRKAASKNRAPR